MLNTSKPNNSLSNTDKVSFAELWSTITTTWATETRTWIETLSLFSNIAKARTEYLATEALDYLMTEDDNYLVTGVNHITNTSKP